MRSSDSDGYGSTQLDEVDGIRSLETRDEVGEVDEEGTRRVCSSWTRSIFPRYGTWSV